MKCKYCGKEFTPFSVTQKYCSRRCGWRYRATREYDPMKESPSVTFICSCCGRLVVTEAGTRDRRTRFCSRSCEKSFYKHPLNSMEKVTGIRNFPSLRYYLWYEKHTNERS